MKRQSQLGLVIEGSATSSATLRVSKLAEELGPVKSATVRVARRLSNVLRAGYAVGEYEDLQAAKLVFLRVPDGSVARTVDELCGSELVLKHMSFVLCDSWLSSDALQALATRGAATATVMNLPTTQRDWFMVEGMSRAVRQTRRFLQRTGARSDELKPGTKDCLFAAQMMTTAVPMATLISAQQALRASGISGNILSTLLEQMSLKMLQDFLRGARAAWGGPLTECSPEISEGHFQSLQQKSPAMAAYLQQQIALAKQVMANSKGATSSPPA